MATSAISGNTWVYSTGASGVTLDVAKGERPEKAPKELLATKAVQLKDGWVGQIIMAGEIIHQTAPFVDDEDAEIEAGSERALAGVNDHILARFRRLITES